MTDKLDPKEQHAKISGYRKLSDSEIALMNRIKELEADFGDLALDVLTHLNVQHEEALSMDTQDEYDRLGRALAGEFYNSATLTVFNGLSQLVRCVAQPENLAYLRYKKQLEKLDDYDIIEQGDGSFDFRINYEELPEEGTDWTVHKQGSSRWLELNERLSMP